MTLLNMRPCPAILDLSDCAFIDAEFGRNNSRHARIRANSAHYFRGQFGHARTLTNRCCPMIGAITHILDLCSPSEIAKEVVDRISICMATIMFSARAWSDKRFKNHYVDSAHFGLSFTTKINCRVPFKTSIGRSNLARDCSGFDIFIVCSVLNGSNAAMVRNFVKAFVPNNGKPFFDHFRISTGVVRSLYQLRSANG